MTDKLNEKTKEFDNSANTPSDNPLEELAKIIGYQDDGQGEGKQDGSANEAVTDLEAELLREFGVEPKDPVSVSQEAIQEPTSSLTPQATQPSSHAAEVDDVLDDMSQYALPSHAQKVDASPKPDVSSQPDLPPVQEDVVQPTIASPVIEPVGDVSSAPTMSRATPVAPQPSTQATETPFSTLPSEPFNTLQSEPEVADLPNPLSTSSPFSSDNNVTTEDVSSEPSFDIGQMSTDLEQELERLQHGLEAGVNEVPEAVMAPVVPQEPQAPQAPEVPFNEVPVSEAASQPVEQVPFPSQPVASEPQVESPFPSILTPQNEAGPQDNSTPPDFAELIATEEPVERTDDLENVLDVSGFAETEADLEETAPFEIPELPKVEEFSREQANMDVDLDLELEREFSQLISGDLSPEQDVQVSSTPNPTADSTHASVSYLPTHTSSEKADIEELNELFNVGVAGPGADAAASVSKGPDRIDVTHDADNIDQDIIGDDETKGSGSNTLAVVGVLAALLLGGGAYLYFQNSGATLGGSSEPIIIKADNSPIKEVPADPGGASVPNQDQAVYEQVEGNDVSVANQSTLVESTEEPVDIVQNTLNPSILPLEGRDLAGDDKNSDRLAPNDEVASADPSNDLTQPLVTPRRVQTVIVQSDGTIITREAPAPEPTPAPVVAESNPVATPTATETAPAVVETPVPAANTEQVETALAVETAPQTVTPTPAPAPAPAAPVAQPEETAPLSNDTAAAIANAPVQAAPEFSGYYMQIASQPSLASAQSSYANLSSRFNSILGGLPVEYQTANIEGKGTFHRVRIQVGSRAEANSLCSRYKSAGGSCFVAR